MLLILPLNAMQGQDIVGQWQGTVQTAAPFRLVVKVLKDSNGLRAFFIWVDARPDYNPVTAVNGPGGAVTFSLGPYASINGRLSTDGNQIDGTWTAGAESGKAVLHRASPDESWLSKSTIRMITVAPNVSLEVIDWGGTGPPLVFLSGLGNTAHVFDNFAPKFVPKYHVFGITRRGYGVSSAPTPDSLNYRADQLGDDIVKVIDSLGLKKPVLVGHSIAGEELSSVGSRFPNMVSGLIYLDAGYAFALYSAQAGDSRLDALEARRELGEYLSASPGADRKRVITDLLSNLPMLQKELERDLKHDELMPGGFGKRPDVSIAQAIRDGERKFTDLDVSILAIFANPHDPKNYFPELPPDKIAKLAELDQATTASQVKEFEKLKSAKVVVLPNAHHYVFSSNEQDVEREMMDFLGALNSR